MYIVEQTSRGYQEHLLRYIRIQCEDGSDCTATTQKIAERTGTTRNVTKKAIRDLANRKLVTLQYDRDDSDHVIQRHIIANG